MVETISAISSSVRGVSLLITSLQCVDQPCPHVVDETSSSASDSRRTTTRAAVDWGKREGVATLPEAIRQLMRLGLAASPIGQKIALAPGTHETAAGLSGLHSHVTTNGYGSA